MSYELLFEKAKQFHEAGDFDNAESLYRRILETNPKNPDVLNLLGLVAQAKGAHEQAIELFYKAIKETPGFLPLYFNLAFSLEAMGKYIEAIDAYLRLDIPESYNNIGNIYQELGDTEKAKAFYTRALSLPEAKASIAFLEEDVPTLENMATPAAHYYLSRINLNKQQFEKALFYSQKIDDFRAYLVTGEALLKLGRKEEAREAFALALEKNPKSVSGLINLANLEENEALYRQAIDLEANNFDAHLNYANLLYSQKRLPEALEEYRRAIVINPNAPELSNNIAVIQRDLGEYEEAIGLFMNAVLNAPQHEHEQFILNLSETLLLFAQTNPENHQKALEIAQNWQVTMPDNLFAKNTFAILEGKPGDDSIYSQALFDNFAATYEQTLNDINYQLPQKIKELIGEVEGTILDLGCGTGLMAEALKSPKNQFVGVDISEKMLQLAQEKNLYQELHQADIIDYLSRHKPRIVSLILSSDTFCYFKDLKDIIKLTNKTPICFSIEVFKGETHRSLTGRYKHNPDEVNQILTRCGYTHIKRHPLTLRYESGSPVEGMIFVAD